MKAQRINRLTATSIPITELQPGLCGMMRTTHDKRRRTIIMRIGHTMEVVGRSWDKFILVVDIETGEAHQIPVHVTIQPVDVQATITINDLDAVEE
jgi:hypothetical protein